MNSSVYAPSAPLQPFIKTYLIIETPHEQINKVLPDTSVVLAFRFKGRVKYLENNGEKSLSPSMISGLRKSGRQIHYAKGTGNILVIFKEAGAHAFFKEPLNELFDHSVALDRFNGYKTASIIEDQLAEAKDHHQRIGLIETFLLKRLCNHKPDPLILTALERMHASRGSIRIKDLANSLCISLDAFEKRFRRIAGVSPKQFLYIIRMRSVLSNGLNKQSLTEAAFEAGYFDQSHFNKDFKLFTGQTPTDFLKSPVYW